MNTKSILLLLIFILSFTLTTGGCDKDEYSPPSDPAKAILGKWELIEIGNWPNMYPTEPSYYIEYLSDSLVGWYDYKTEEYFIKNFKYWIDSLYHEKRIREDGYEIIQKYSYEFYDDKLRMDMLDVLPIFETFIYQRKK